MNPKDAQNAASAGNERLLAVKTKMEALKVRVRELQAELPQYKADAEMGRRGGWTKYREMKQRWQAAVDQLGQLKLELIALSGTGSDPKWGLIAEAWRILDALEESGVDIGERGRKLLDDIEFHVPMSKLQAPA